MNNIRFTAYYAFVFTCSVIIFFWGIYRLPESSYIAALHFAVLSIMLESLTFRTTERQYVSLGYALSLCLIVIFQPPVAALLIGIGSFFSITVIDGKVKHLFNIPLQKHVFNTAAVLLLVYISGMVYQHIAAFIPTFLTVSGIDIIAFILATFVYTSLEILMFSLLFTLLGVDSFKENIKSNLNVYYNLISVAPIGYFMALTYQMSGFFSVVLFAGPLIIARYYFVKVKKLDDNTAKFVKILVKSIEAKDPYTKDHTNRVSEYAVRLGDALGLTSRQLKALGQGAILHDIGKIGISDTILNKPGKLTHDEYQTVKEHPLIGYAILEDSELLKAFSHMVRDHHEYYNGMGYPNGLKGEQISIEASIIAVVDAFDAMTSDRSYRQALSHQAALEQLRQQSGEQFNPVVVNKFIDLIEQEYGNSADRNDVNMRINTNYNL